MKRPRITNNYKCSISFYIYDELAIIDGSAAISPETPNRQMYNTVIHGNCRPAHKSQGAAVAVGNCVVNIPVAAMLSKLAGI